MRTCFLALIFLFFSFAAHAVEKPADQIPVDVHKALRGTFVHEHKDPRMPGSLRTSGHFLVAPVRGLIWDVERPIPTTTVITPTSVVQIIKKMDIKVPVRNLRMLYDLVAGALAGNWSVFEGEYLITRSVAGNQWKFVLVPKPTGTVKPSYSVIIVTGGAYVSNIVFSRNDGGYDALSFSDMDVAPVHFSVEESDFFDQAQKQ